LAGSHKRSVLAPCASVSGERLENQFRGDGDGGLQSPVDGAAIRKEFVDAAGRFPVFGLGLQPQFGVNAADNEDAILGFYFANGLGNQPCIRGIDVTRFQRASEGAGESAGCRRDYVVECGRMRLQHIRRDVVVLGDRAMHAEDHRRRLSR
jgi:hypothetical protein